MIHPEAHAPAGDILDYEGDPATVYRSLDTLVIPAITVGLDGIREARKALDAGEAGILAYRFRTIDLSGINLDEVRYLLATLGLEPFPEETDWVAVGHRLEAIRQYGGYDELRKLHALLAGTGAPGSAPAAARLCKYCDAEPAATGNGYCEACAPAIGVATGTPDDDEGGPTYGVAELCDATMPLPHGGELKCTTDLDDTGSHPDAHSALGGKRRWIGTGESAHIVIPGEPTGPATIDGGGSGVG